MLVTKKQEQGQEAEQLSRLFADVSNRAKFVRDHKIPGGSSMVAQHLSGHRPISMEAGVAYARAFNVPLSAVSQRLASMQDLLSNLTSEQTQNPMSAGVAQDLSQSRPIVSLPKVAWEDLKMGATPNQPFELDVIDDSLAPEIFAGCVALLDPGRPPEPAWPVLVRDKRGDVYLRDYEAGPGNTWRAVARARGFRNLDSEDDGLTIIASMDGYRRPRKQ